MRVARHHVGLQLSRHRGGGPVSVARRRSVLRGALLVLATLVFVLLGLNLSFGNMLNASARMLHGGGALHRGSA